MNARNLLSIATVLLVFPALWILHGKGIIVLPETVIGMTITVETLMVNFYFRKKEGT